MEGLLSTGLTPSSYIHDNLKLGEERKNKIMDIEEGPFEILDIVQEAMNNYDVAINNDNNEFIKMVTNLADKENIKLQKIKSTCSCYA